MLLLVSAVQIHAALVEKEIEVIEYETVSDPRPMGDNVYQAADGTEVTVPEGEDPTDPKHYIDENGNHGVPTARVKHTYKMTVLIPEEIDTPENTNLLEDELKDYLHNQYTTTGDDVVTAGAIMEKTVEEKWWIFSYDKEYKAAAFGKMETTVISRSTVTINQSNSVQVGDPVLMTSGQYRYDETDIVVSAGNAILEIGRHYQSEENKGDSLGRKWFFSLDTRILRGTSISTEQTYTELINTLQTLTNDLNSLKNTKSNAENKYNTDIIKLGDDITAIEDAITELKNSRYSSYNEIKTYINDLEKKLDLLNEILGDKRRERDCFLTNTQTYIDEFEIKLNEKQTSVASIKLIADLSAYNRKCNARAERGYGFNEQTEIGTQIITVYDTNGRKSLYEVKTEAQPTPNGIGNPYPNGAETVNISGGTDTLRINPDESFSLTKRDGTVWLYGADGMLRSITDRNNNKITISYENGKAVSISANGNKLRTLVWQGDRISAIVNARDSSDRVEYYYSNGRLSAVKDNDGDTISFGYMDCSGDYLDSIQKPDGSIVCIEYGYVRDGAKLVSRTSNEEGEWETFSYSQSGKKVEHTTHSGIVTLYEYDENHQLTKQIDADGTVKEYGYDIDGNVIWEKLNGNKTDYIYNTFGDKTRANYSDGSYESWTYDVYGQITSYKDRDGVSYEYIRDTHGNLIALRCGGKTLYSYEYDAKGQMTSVTMFRADGTSYTQRFSYDINGNLTERIIGDGTSGLTGITGSATIIKETWTYDGRNRVLSYSINGKTEESYSYNGRETTVTSNNGLITTYTTDNRKDYISVEEKDTITGETRFTKVTYDRRHLPIKRTLSEGEDAPPIVTAEYRYLPGGEPIAELIRSGDSIIITIYDYTDANGNQTNEITKVQRIKCTDEQLEEAGADLDKLRSITEDSYSVSYKREITQNGTRLTVTAPDGLSTVTEYDAWSRPVAATDASGITSSREYSPAGRLKKAQSSYGGINVYAYDATGTLIGAGHENGIMASSETNPDGNPYRTTDRNGRTTEYTYDALNRLVKVTQAAGSRYFYYDDHGRVTLAVTGGDGTITTADEYTSYEYSDDGRTVTASMGGLYPVSYTLDAWGETTSVTDGEGNTRHITYDCAGRATSEKDAYGNIMSYEYDVRGLVTKAIYPDGTISEYKYDVYGNMTESILCGKTVWQGRYDSAGRLIEQEGKLSASMAYNYDDAGRLSEVYTAGTLTSSYDYEDNGRTVSVTSGNNHVYTYKYDEFGLLDFETNRSGLTQNYIYDKNDEISSLLRFSGESTSYTESQDGLTRTTSFSDGTSGSVTYTLSGRVKSIKNASGEVVYEYDKGGKLIKQTDIITGETVTYRYDKAGRRTQTIGEGQNLTMSYGKNGELVTIHDRVTNTGYKLEYDSMMREIKRTAENGVRTETMYNQDGSVDCIITRESRGAVITAEAYVYGNDGRKKASIDTDGEVTLYEYDSFGRLSSVLHPDTEATARYEHKIIDDLDITEFRFTASESRYLSKNVYEKVARLQILCHNINSMIPSYRNFRAERFKYDADGNMTERQIGGALIEYTYDADDRLISCANGGKTLRTYSYDDDGNLTKITNPSAPNTTNEFTYDGSGRMVSSITNNEGARQEQAYGYDALGRRVSVSLRTGDNGRSTVRTAYDGTGMNVLREANDRGLTASGAVTIPLGERYRYIDDSTADNGRTSGNTASGDDIMNGTAGFRTRTTLYIGSSPAAVSADGESRYLSGDDIGSVRCVTDAYGMTTATLSYDIFGTPYADSEYGYDDVMFDAVITRAAYTGKPYDPVTGLYDYGFRDYSPTLARFTTPDPIRDGTNWYAYCAGDPVNFVDKWGLKQVFAEDTQGNAIAIPNGKELKDYLKLETTRGENSNTNSAYPDKTRLMINNQVYDSCNAQSSITRPQTQSTNGEYTGTLAAGLYDAVIRPLASTRDNSEVFVYEVGFSISGNGIDINWGFMIHPDWVTNPNNKNYGTVYNPPISDGCTVTEGDSFINKVYNLALGAGLSEWDSIPYEIIDDKRQSLDSASKNK
ncbi:MAG: hypothetical protein J5747_04325 [Spirochaetaceae bacterium]|nr:hypothetical protein [Spirochaetaceae bacterium]